MVRFAYHCITILICNGVLHLHITMIYTNKSVSCNLTKKTNLLLRSLRFYSPINVKIIVMYLVGRTKLFLNRYLAKFFNISVKPFFPYT